MPRPKRPAKRTRKRGEGSLRERRVGKRVFYEARLAAHKTKDGVRKSFYGATVAEAIDKRNKYLAETNQPIAECAEDLPQTTLSEFAKLFLENRRANKRLTTCENYENTLRKHILPYIGARPIAALTDSEVVRFYKQLEQNTSASMRRRVHVTLRAVLNYAVERKAIAVSPLATIKQDTPKYRPPEINPLTENEVARLLTACQDDRLGALIILAVDSGARQGELFGLHWDDCDLAKREIFIHQAAVQTSQGVEIGPLKTKTSRRRVPITPETVKALHRRKKLAAQEGLGDNPLVFPSERGYVLRKENFRNKTWVPIRRAAGLPNARFHDLRHTTATLLMRAGVHPKVVQERLGHFSVSLTLDVYARVVPGMQAGAAKALSGVLGRLTRSRKARPSS